MLDFAPELFQARLLRSGEKLNASQLDMRTLRAIANDFFDHIPVHSELAVVRNPRQHRKNAVVLFRKAAQKRELRFGFRGKYPMKIGIGNQLFDERGRFINAGDHHFAAVHAERKANLRLARRTDFQP